MASKEKPLNELSVTEIADGIADKRFTPEAVVRSCLDRISEREPEVKAWIHLDPELALSQARVLENGPSRGPLHGVPIGIKDIIDTFDMPTQMGSPIYDGHQPAIDASCVAILRKAGAIILGKTVTAEFAGVEPGATANPHDTSRTPGGSSSGSAAAVADYMVPVALGTQTGGSILRPAAFCGVIGFKPSYGTVNRAGMKFAADSLDTIGPIGRSIDDVELICDVLTGQSPAPTRPEISAPRVGLCRTPLWDTADAETVEAIEDTAAKLSAAGASVNDVELPADFAGIGEARDIINNFERSRATAYEWDHHRERISERLGASLKKGYETPYEDYLGALRLGEDWRLQLEQIFASYDVLLSPSVPGEAPIGLSSTGAPQFQGFWTILRVPTISLPTHTGPNGLPVGIQLIGRYRDDKKLLDTARWVLSHVPPL